MKEDFKHLSLASNFEIDDSFDSEKFIKMRIRVCHDGENPNGSSFEVEDYEKAKDSIKNIPILAHVIFDEDGNPQFGSHDMHIEADKINNDEYRLIYDESPIGVVPETSNYTIEEFNGRNYVFVDAFIWKEYSNYAQDVIERDKNINISMEIAVDAYSYDGKTNTYHITDFRYKGITFLGNNVGTGMIDAMATTDSFSDENKKKLFTLMTELKEDIERHQSSELEVDNKETFKKEDLGLEGNKTATNNFSATYNQKREALRNALDSIYVKDENGNIIESTYYYIMDFNDDYVFVEKDFWDDEGNFEETHGRITYSFDESTLTATVTGEWEEMYLMWLTADEKASIESAQTNYSTLQSEFESYKETYSIVESEVNELREFKKTADAEKRKYDEEQVFSKPEFETIKDCEEFKALVGNAHDFDIETLTDKCFAILGRANANFSAKIPVAKESVKITLDMNDADSESNEPYGGLFSKIKK